VYKVEDAADQEVMGSYLFVVMYRLPK